MVDRWVVLVGMMGSGKTSVGRGLAERLHIPFHDTDRLLERHLGRAIHHWFQLYGEDSFRDHESRILRELNVEPGVLSTGGGIVIRDENWAEIRRLGPSVFLDVEPELLKDRLAVARKRRPLLETEDWEQRFDELYARRRSRYEMADIALPINDESETIPEVVERLVAALELE